MPDATWTYALLAASAFLAGAMNSIAGGGTLLTFPALTAALGPALGVGAAAAANATSTFALLPGSLAGATAFRRELATSRRFVLRMIAPSVVGGLIGTWLVIRDEKAFSDLVPWLILTAALLFLLQQPVSRWMRARRPDREPGRGLAAGLIGFQFLIALYGGYFGAGIGILMLASLGFMGVGDIHRMNAVKTFLASAINASSVAVFAAHDKIRWEYAWPMVAAAVVGGYAGASVSRRLPAPYVRGAAVAIGFGLAAYYFAG